MSETGRVLSCEECGHPDGQHDEAGCIWPQSANTPGVPTCPCAHGSSTGPALADDPWTPLPPEAFLPESYQHPAPHVVGTWSGECLPECPCGGGNQ